VNEVEFLHFPLVGIDQKGDLSEGKKRNAEWQYDFAEAERAAAEII
jgi:hypothetical protein